MFQSVNNFLRAVLIVAVLAVTWNFPLKQIKPQAVGSVESLVPENVEIPIRWGDLGMRLTETGVIDSQKFAALYEKRGGLPQEISQLLTTNYKGKIVINQSNSHFYLNLLWAFGLSNKNSILENGPMTDQKYGGADRFASTGGWTLASGKSMDHYSKHNFVTLTEKQQKLVEEISKNIYRPCCNNSTYFPDCNHGMAMLGLLELMAANNLSESKMYQIALKVNALWFPSTYETISRYLAAKSISLNEVGAKELLGNNYSSGSGYRKILQEVEPATGGGSSCGI